MTDQELIQAARAMLERAYAPFSHYTVGAALLGSDGRVYTGCNIESAAFGPRSVPSGALFAAPLPRAAAALSGGR